MRRARSRKSLKEEFAELQKYFAAIPKHDTIALVTGDFELRRRGELT
jgi:hypothetical protein